MEGGQSIADPDLPAKARNGQLEPAAESKRVVVVGGEAGGLYAAWACALRGHQVTLLEKDAKLGGNFRIAAYPTGKGQLTEAIRSLIVKCRQAGVDLRCGTEADEALLKSLSPDAVILATGSTPLVLPIPGNAVLATGDALEAALQI